MSLAVSVLSLVAEGRVVVVVEGRDCLCLEVYGCRSCGALKVTYRSPIVLSVAVLMDLVVESCVLRYLRVLVSRDFAVSFAVVVSLLRVLWCRRSCC